MGSQSEHIQQWLQQHERRTLLNLAVVERMAGVPRNTLHNLVSINRPLPARHVSALVDVLGRMGYPESERQNHQQTTTPRKWPLSKQRVKTPPLA